MPVAVYLALTTQVVRAALPSLISSVVGALATDPAFTAAITAEVRRTTSRFTEAVLFGGEMPLPASLQATLTGATGGVMELGDDAGDCADLIDLSN